MATYTPNYNLEKPDASDNFGDFRASYNSNMDIIDQNLGGGGGGGGGHTIVDPDGTTMPNRSKLKFTGSVSVTDDSANNQTVVNITGGGGGGGEYYLNDGLIGSSGGTYITCNLDKTLVNGYYLVVVDDAGSRTYTYMEWNGTTQTLVIGANWQLQITSTTAGLTYYSGAWRNIYCDILSLGGSGGGSGDTVSWTQIQATGEKIAEITINGTTTDVLIPFEAKIIVTTTTGLTVTATKGGTTYTATETSTGVYEVIVDSKGTWTVTDGTNTTTVSVTAQTTYNVAFVVIPDGSTVTPTDDIQTWLNCANIWDKAYTTLAEVLADSTTLSALISDNNATDYLVRSTTWASGMCADSTAMTYIGLNNYCANTLLADATWRTAICNSTYFESVLNVKVPVMTSATTPAGTVYCGNYYSETWAGWRAYPGENGYTNHWASDQQVGNWNGYDFGRPVKIYKTIAKAVTITGDSSSNYGYSLEGLNDSLVWENVQSGGVTTGATPLISAPTRTYSRYRINITSIIGTTGLYLRIYGIQFYGREDV